MQPRARQGHKCIPAIHQSVRRPRQSATALSLLLDGLWPAELRRPDAAAHLKARLTDLDAAHDSLVDESMRTMIMKLLSPGFAKQYSLYQAE